MDGWRALNLEVYVWIQDGFNIEKERWPRGVGQEKRHYRFAGQWAA
jgi:hypothetical protein